MSREVDSRIVEMQFNNKQFEDGISDSLQSLDDLKLGLNNMEGAGKALDNVGEAASGLEVKLSAMSTIAMQALSRLTDAVIDFGINTIKSLALDPIFDGLKEYETKMDSITTILTNTQRQGTKLEDVNNVLGELNDYADQTIYNFGQMTSYMGKFTASGVALEDSAAAIKGISNLAAGAGASANQAASAMYNLSQSISSGKLMLQDWNSVVNAGLGGPVFQDALINAAENLGQIDAELVNMYRNGEASFRSLIDKSQYGVDFTKQALLDALAWAASDETLTLAATQVKTFTQLMDTLKESVGSGWAVTWEHIIGDREEAIALFTGINNAIEAFIGPITEARNSLVEFWAENGGRAAVIEGLSNAFNGLIVVLKPIGDAFRDIFPPMTGERIVEISKAFRDLTAQFNLGDDRAEKLRRTFAGIFAIVDILATSLGGLFSIFGKVIGKFLPASEGILHLTAGLGDFMVALRNSMHEGEFWGKTIEKIGEVLEKLSLFFSNFTKSIKSDFVDVFGPIEDILYSLKNFLIDIGSEIQVAIIEIGNHIRGFGKIDLDSLFTFSGELELAFKPFTFIANAFKKAWELVVGVWTWAAPIIIPITQKVSNAMSKFSQALIDAFKSGDLQKFANLFTTGALGVMFLKIREFFDGLKDLGEGAKGMMEGVTEILDGVRGSLEAYQTKLKSQALLAIAGAIAILVASLWVLSGIDGGSLAVSLAAITTLFIELASVMMLMGTKMKGVKMGGIALQMVGISTAVLILASALKMLSDISSEDLFSGITAIGILLAELIGFVRLVGNGEGIMKIGLAMIPLATGILILSRSVKSLADLDWEELAKGLTGIVGMLAAVSLASKVISPGPILVLGAAMIPLSTGLLILSQAVKSMTGLNWGELSKGLIGLSGMLLAVSLTSKLVQPSQILALGVAMLGVGTGILVLAGAMHIMAMLSWGDLVKGLIGIAGALGILAITSKLIKPTTLLSMSVALTGVGIGLTMIMAAMLGFGTMSWESMAKSMIMLAGSLTVLAIAANVMKGAIAGALAITVMAGALVLLTPSLLLLGSMDLANIGVALLMLAGVFTIFGVAGLLLAPLAPVLVLLGGAVILLGVGVLALGTGLVSLAAGIGAIAVGGTSFILALTTMIMAIIDLIPAAATALAEGLLLFIKTISDGIPIIMDFLTNFVDGLVTIFVDLTPKLLDAVFAFLIGLVDKLISFFPKLVELGTELILSILQGISENIQEVTDLALEIIMNFLKGLADGIPGVVDAAADLMIAFIQSLGEQIPRLVDAGFKMIIDLCNGLADAIRENAEELGEAAANLALAIIEGIVKGLTGFTSKAREGLINVGKAMWDGFKSFFGIHSPSTLMEGEAGNIIMGLLKGFTAGISNLVAKAKEIGTAIFDNIKSSVGNVQSIASNVISTLGDSLRNGVDTVKSSAKAIGRGILDGVKGVLGIQSPATTMIDAAHDTGKGLIIGMRDMIKPVGDAAKNLGGDVIDKMKDSLKRIAENFDSDMDVTPVIRPVIDMSDVESGLQHTFDRTRILDIGEIKNRAEEVARSRTREAVDTVDTVAKTTSETIADKNITIINHYHVRNDSDIQRINAGLDNIITKFSRTRGVPVRAT